MSSRYPEADGGERWGIKAVFIINKNKVEDINYIQHVCRFLCKYVSMQHLYKMHWKLSPTKINIKLTRNRQWHCQGRITEACFGDFMWACCLTEKIIMLEETIKESIWSRIFQNKNKYISCSNKTIWLTFYSISSGGVDSFLNWKRGCPNNRGYEIHP